MKLRSVVVPFVVIAVAAVLVTTTGPALFRAVFRSAAMADAVDAPDCFDVDMVDPSAMMGTLRVYMSSGDTGKMALGLDQRSPNLAYHLKGGCDGKEMWQAAKICEMADARYRIRMWRERDRLRVNIKDTEARQASVFAANNRSLLLTPRRGHICFPG